MERPPVPHTECVRPRRPACQAPAAAATQTAGTSGSGTPLVPILALAYFTKYQFSGLMPSVGLCGRAPLRLLFTSVSEYTPFGWNITGSCCAR
jgi:hypothetical protein